MMEYILVHYCPCGHLGLRSKSDIPNHILDELATGKRLSAPTKPSTECPECEDIARARDVRLAYFLGE